MKKLNIVQVGSHVGGDAVSDFFKHYAESVELGGAELDGVPILDARTPDSAFLTVFREEENSFNVEGYLKSIT